MSIIKKVILFIKNLFNSLFGKRKVTKKIKTGINNTRNKRYLKGYGRFVEEAYNETLPIYLMISENDKKKLVNKMVRIEERILNGDIDDKNLLINVLGDIERRIEEGKISFYQNERIDEVLDCLLLDKEIDLSTKEKVISLQDNINEILENFDNNIKDKVKREYEQVNFVTISTLLLDETIEEINKLMDDYKHHKYNKYYYDRELNKIKERINNLKKLYDSARVREELLELRKNLYTKSKDKYDLLYNDEVLINLNNQCNELLDKVNKRIIDLKKEKVKEKKNIKDEIREDKRKEIEYYENILKRFKDLELARKILMFKNLEEMDVSNIKNLMQTLNKTYYDFISEEKGVFNFERNKTKTELVSLYNNLNRINGLLTNDEYVFIDHINYRMDDLLEATINKKKELESFLESKYQYKSEEHEESILVDNKLSILKEKEDKKDDAKVLIKKPLQDEDEKINKKVA